MSDFLMPSLGADMESGTLLEWYVKPGDTVTRGDIVALVDTSKAEIEIEIFEDGVIGELLVPEGTRVPVGAVLATVSSVGAPVAAGAAVPSAAAVAAPVPSAGAAAAPVPSAVAVAAPAPSAAAVAAQAAVAPAPAAEHRLRVSPLARRASQELRVDLSSVSGSGPNGAITKADVERASSARASGPQDAGALTSPPPASPPAAAPAPSVAPAAPAVPAHGPTDRQTAMRHAIGELMARSKREIPHYYLQFDIDMSRALQWLHAENLARSVEDRLLPSVLLLAAVARAAAEMPQLNGFWIDGAFQPGAGVQLGVAIALRGGGLIAPALRDAEQSNLDAIMAGLRDLVARARAGRLRGSEMSDPTITVTNLGDRGVDLVHGVIYPPQVALVGFGAARERPWAVNGLLGVRPVVTATLAADHRASDGHEGSRFLALIDRKLQTPEEL